MGRTINRQPFSVNQLDYNDLNQQYFNQLNFKGICDDENYITIDQETFADANNVYVDDDGLLKSRPSLKTAKQYNPHNDVLPEQYGEIINSWSFEIDTENKHNYVQIYQYTSKLLTDVYYLRVYLNNKSCNLGALYSYKNCIIIPYLNYLYIFTGELGSTNNDYNKVIVINDIGCTVENLSEYIYVPTTTVIVNGVETEVESENLLTYQQIYQYVYGYIDDDTFSDWPSIAPGTLVTIKVNDTTYKDVEFSELLKRVVVTSRMEASTDDEIAISDRGQLAIYNYSTGVIKYSPDSKIIIREIEFTNQNGNIDLYGTNYYVYDSSYPKHNGKLSFSGDGKYLVKCASYQTTDGAFYGEVLLYDLYSYGGWSTLSQLNNVYASESLSDKYWHYGSTMTTFGTNLHINCTLYNLKTFAIVYCSDSDGTITIMAMRENNWLTNNVVSSVTKRCSPFNLLGMDTISKNLAAELNLNTSLAIQGINKHTDIRIKSAIVNDKFVVATSYTPKNTNNTKYTHLLAVHIESDGKMDTTYYPIGLITTNLNTTSQQSYNNSIDFKFRKDKLVIFADKRTLNSGNIGYISNKSETDDLGCIIYIYDIGDTYVIQNATVININHKFTFTTKGRVYVNENIVAFDDGVSTNEFFQTYLTSNNHLIDATNDIYYISNGTIYSSYGINKIILTSVVGEKKFNPINFNHWNTLNDAYYLSSLNDLYVSIKRVDDNGKLLWYLPEKFKEEMQTNITYLQPISTTEMGIFSSNNIYISNYDSENELFRYTKSRVGVGCIEGSTVVTSIDGKYTIFSSEQGIVALQYQDFIASTEQSLLVMSDNIRSLLLDANDENTVPIKLFIHKYYMYCIIENSKMLFLYDFRNSTWWRFTFPKNVLNFFIVQSKLYMVFNDDVCNYDFTEDNYVDEINSKHFDIEWAIVSQKLHLGQINYLKHVNNLTLHDNGEVESERDFKLDFVIYQKIADVTKNKYLHYDVNFIRTFCKRLNLMKVQAFQYKLSSVEPYLNDDRVSKLSLSGLTIKYTITTQVR